MVLLGLLFELGWFVSLDKAGHMIKTRLNMRRVRYCTVGRDLLKSSACFVICSIEGYTSTINTFRKFPQIFPKVRGTSINIYLVCHIYIFSLIFQILINPFSSIPTNKTNYKFLFSLSSVSAHLSSLLLHSGMLPQPVPQLYWDFPSFPPSLDSRCSGSHV